MEQARYESVRNEENASKDFLGHRPLNWQQDLMLEPLLLKHETKLDKLTIPMPETEK